MGVGSTGIAAKNLNRKFIGIELNKEYFDATIRRFKAHEQKMQNKQ
jgi:DNA modification methylase